MFFFTFHCAKTRRIIEVNADNHGEAFKAVTEYMQPFWEKAEVEFHGWRHGKGHEYHAKYQP
jgi:hypothetical protein